MRTNVPANGQRGSDAAASPGAGLLELLRRGTIARLLPVAGEASLAAEAELRRRFAEAPTDALQDDLTTLAILRRHATMYERSWQDHLGAGFDGWPQPPRLQGRDPFALVSEDELQSQLVGQPVIEALDRRFADVLDVIDSRLWSLAADLGAAGRPTNPVGSRAIVEAFLATFPAAECSPGPRQALLRHLERLAGEHFGELYAWVNKTLSDAGFAMTRAADYALLMASPMGAGGQVAAPGTGGPRAIWSNDNALDATDSTWREGKRGRARATGAQADDAERGNALRQWVRRVRGDHAEPAASAQQARELRDEEFLAVLSLLQGDADRLRATATGRAGLAGRLRDHVRQGAARLGMDHATTRFSVAQDDAIDLAGSVFDGLVARHALAPGPAARLQRLCCPYLRLALTDPYLFDDAGHAANAWLSFIVDHWDGSADPPGHDDELAGSVEDSVDDVMADFHGDIAVFEQALAGLRQASEARRQRAAIAERRAWQSVQGRERLQAARSAADQALRPCLEAAPLLDSVAMFLCDQWRQSLVHAWLRDGDDSLRYRDACAVGAAMVATDAAAAAARGAEVAQRLIALQQPVHDCFVACGLDGSGANELLARLVADLSRPDAQRQRHPFTPLADADVEVEVDPGDQADPGDPARSAQAPPVVGQSLLSRAPGEAPLLLRACWISPLTGSILAVNRQGARHAVWSPTRFASLVASGSVVPRHADGAVEGVLEALHASAMRMPAAG